MYIPGKYSIPVEVLAGLITLFIQALMWWCFTVRHLEMPCAYFRKYCYRF